MRAMVYEGPEILTIKEVPDVTPKAGEVKLKIRACGICGSDVHGYLGITGRRIPPLIMGHEFSGEVVELGEGVTDVNIGDRVAAYPLDFCGHCEKCLAGDVHLCLNKRAFGVLTVDGAFTEYICVPAKCCFQLKENVSYTVGSIMEPLAVSYRAVRHAGDLKDKTVMVVGAGTIGLLALACIVMQKPKKVFVSDLSDTRLEIAKKMGADVVINSGKEDPVKVIMDHTDGRGINAVIEAVDITPTVKQGIDALDFGGVAVWIGISAQHIDLEMQKIVTRELTVKGTFLYGFEEFRTVVGFLNDGHIDVTPVISKEVTLDELPAAFEKLHKDPGDWIKVTYIND